MTLYAFPADLCPAETVVRWVDDQIALPAMTGGAVQRVDFNGGLWAIDVRMPPLTGDDHRLLRNWLFKIGRVGNWGQITDHSYSRAGVGGGTPLVKGASQDGLTLVMDGATADVTGWLKAGDRIGLANGRLVEVATDCDSDSSGNVTASLVNPILDAPDDNSAVEIDAPALVVRIADPSFSYDNRPADFHGHAFTLIQDITSGAPDPVYS